MSRDEGEGCHNGLGAKLRIVIASSILLYREGLVASRHAGRQAQCGRPDGYQFCTELARLLSPDALGARRLDGGRARAGSADEKRGSDPCAGRIGISGSPAEVIGCAESGLAGFIDQESSIDALVTVITDAVRW